MKWNRCDEQGGGEFCGTTTAPKPVRFMSVELPKWTDLLWRNDPARGNRFASAGLAVIYSLFPTLQACVASSSVALQYASGANKYFIDK
jgi:hypothetical protein